VEYERLVKDELYSTDELYAKDVIDVLEKLKACVKGLQVMSLCVCVCVCVACVKRLQVILPQKSAVQYRVAKMQRML